MQAGNVLRVRTDKDVHFTGAINAGAAATETLAPPTYVPEALAAGRHNRGRLKAIRILSKENLAWELMLYANSLFATSNADTQFPLGRWTFVESDGVIVSGDTYYFYYVDGLDVAIEDLDKLGQINIRLVNRSGSAKTAGANGNMIVELAIELTQGI